MLKTSIGSVHFCCNSSSILVVFNAKNLSVSIELEIETRFRKLQSEIQKSNHLSRDQKMVSSSCEHLNSGAATIQWKVYKSFMGGKIDSLQMQLKRIWSK